MFLRPRTPSHQRGCERMRCVLTQALGGRSQEALDKHDLINAAFDSAADAAGPSYSDRPVVYDETERWRQVGALGGGACVGLPLSAADGLNVKWLRIRWQRSEDGVTSEEPSW